MRTLKKIGMTLLVGFFLTGCARITTQVVEKPRVDQELEGNRGYLAGSGPAPVQRKTTRRMLQTDVEMPTWDELHPWKKRAKPEAKAPAASPDLPAWEEETPLRGTFLDENLEEAARPDTRAWQPPAVVEEPEESVLPALPSQPLATYTVEKGDTLEKISQKFYGTTRRWKRIYEANREVLRNPNRVYPGQTLTIPSLEEEPSRAPAEEESFK